MSWSALSDSFEYLCYGSTPIINIFTLRPTVRGSNLVVRMRRQITDVYRRQILKTKVIPRTHIYLKKIFFLSPQKYIFNVK